MSKDELIGRTAEVNNAIKQLATIEGLMNLTERVKYAPITKLLREYLKGRIDDLREYWHDYYNNHAEHISSITQRICPLAEEQKTEWCRGWNCNKYDSCKERIANDTKRD